MFNCLLKVRDVVRSLHFLLILYKWFRSGGDYLISGHISMLVNDVVA